MSCLTKAKVSPERMRLGEPNQEGWCSEEAGLQGQEALVLGLQAQLVQ